MIKKMQSLEPEIKKKETTNFQKNLMKNKELSR